MWQHPVHRQDALQQRHHQGVLADGAVKVRAVEHQVRPAACGAATTWRNTSIEQNNVGDSDTDAPPIGDVSVGHIRRYLHPVTSCTRSAD
jgi:hypothetical protein